MATKSYRLRMGHQTTFRRTVDPNAKKPEKQKGGEAYQLVFEPGQDYLLSDEELAGLEKEIETGLLVPTDKDEHGRQRVNPKRIEHQEPVKKGPDGELIKPEEQPPTKAPKGRVGGTPGARRATGPNVGAKTEVPPKSAAAKKAARAGKRASAKKK